MTERRKDETKWREEMKREEIKQEEKWQKKQRRNSDKMNKKKNIYIYVETNQDEKRTN